MIYELLYIIPSNFSDTEIDRIQKSVEERLNQNEAKIEKSEVLGKLKLAYPIKKINHGTYVLVYMEVEGEKIKKIDQDLRLADEVLRHVLVARENGIPSGSYKLVAYQPPLTTEGKRTMARRERPQIQQNTQAPETPAQEKMSKEEIDKKLDAILDDADLKV